MTSDYLSPEGQRRKAEMARFLTNEVVRRRHRRNAGKAASLLAIIALGVWLLRPPATESPAPERSPRFQQIDFAIATGSRAHVASWIVQPTDTSRFRVGDGELGELLEQAGHSRGFLRVGNRVVLTEPLGVASSD